VTAIRSGAAVPGLTDAIVRAIAESLRQLTPAPRVADCSGASLPGTVDSAKLGAVEGAPMAKAIWHDTVLAESDRCELVEGNPYLPPDSVGREFLRDSSTHTVCGWKGTASYCDVVVNGETNRDAAWYYPEPKDAARNIPHYVAFWHGVQVEP